MDWIERWWGVSPDGGDGTLEMVIVAAVVALVTASALLLGRRTRWLVLQMFVASAARLQRKHWNR